MKLKSILFPDHFPMDYAEEAAKVQKERKACCYKHCPDESFTMNKEGKRVCRVHWEWERDEQDREQLRALDLLTKEEKIAYIKRLYSRMSEKIPGD